MEQLNAEKKRLEAELFRKERLILDLRKLIPDNIARHFESTLDQGYSIVIEEKFEKFDLQQAARNFLDTSEQTFKVIKFILYNIHLCLTHCVPKLGSISSKG